MKLFLPDKGNRHIYICLWKQFLWAQLDDSLISCYFFKTCRVTSVRWNVISRLPSFYLHLLLGCRFPAATHNCWGSLAGWRGFSFICVSPAHSIVAAVPLLFSKYILSGWVSETNVHLLEFSCSLMSRSGHFSLTFFQTAEHNLVTTLGCDFKFNVLFFKTYFCCFQTWKFIVFS